MVVKTELHQRRTLIKDKDTLISFCKNSFAFEIFLCMEAPTIFTSDDITSSMLLSTWSMKLDTAISQILRLYSRQNIRSERSRLHEAENGNGTEPYRIGCSHTYKFKNRAEAVALCSSPRFLKAPVQLQKCR